MMRNLLLISVIALGLSACAQNRTIWNTHGKMDSGGRTIWNTHGKMNQSDRTIWKTNGKVDDKNRKIWVDSKGKEIIK